MTTTQSTAGDLREGRYVIFDGKACTVKSTQKSKTGKHGSAKCRIEAVSIIDGQKIIKVMPASDNVEVPIIEKSSAQILSVKEDVASVMDMISYEPFDLKIPEELKDQVKEGSQVLYWTILNEKVMKQLK